MLVAMPPRTIEPIQREAGNRFVSNSTGIGSLPLVVGLGAAIGLMKRRGMPAVETRFLSCGTVCMPASRK